jgi:hypothetical protein
MFPKFTRIFKNVSRRFAGTENRTLFPYLRQLILEEELVVQESLDLMVRTQEISSGQV